LELSPLLRSPVVALATGFVLLGGILVAIAMFLFNLQGTNQQLADGLERNLELATLLTQIQGAETGQRGFLLTDDPAYIDSHAVAVAEIDKTLTTISGATSGHFAFLPENLKALRDAVAAKLEELNQTIELARSGRKPEALAVVNTDRGEKLMQDIRDAVARMRARSAAAVASELEHEKNYGIALWAGIAAAALGIVLLAALLIRDARGRTAVLRAQANELAERNVALEETNRRLSEEISSRQEAETQVRQLQKMEAIGQLSGGIAHDFNNMLAVVMSAISLIRRKMARGDFDISQFLDGAADAADRAATLTSRLLAFSRQQPLAPEAIDANKLVSGMSELLRRTLGETVSLETVLAGGLWRTRADPHQLENSIINLAVNARDAMSDGGSITIETANAYLDDAYARANSGTIAGQYVMIAVTDTGSGMSESVIARAFDPFFTTKAPGKGTGLGLSQVFGFVKQSQGHIKIYSEPSTGTTVKVYLPRYTGDEEPAAARKAAVSTALIGGSASEVILIAEDDDQLRSMVCGTMREIGYTVIDTGDAEHALALIRERPDVTLLFTDIVMPKMTGRVLADEALRGRPDLKVLYTTGFTRNAVVHNGVLDAGVNLIVKPFTVEQLAAKVRAVLDGQ
jgi:signal transduction histidine kinase